MPPDTHAQPFSPAPTTAGPLPPKPPWFPCPMVGHIIPCPALCTSAWAPSPHPRLYPGCHCHPLWGQSAPSHGVKELWWLCYNLNRCQQAPSTKQSRGGSGTPGDTPGRGWEGLSQVTCWEQEEAAGKDADVHAVPFPPAAALHHLLHQLRELRHQGFLVLPCSLRGSPGGHVPVTQCWPRLPALCHHLCPAATGCCRAAERGVPHPPEPGGSADLTVDLPAPRPRRVRILQRHLPAEQRPRRLSPADDQPQHPDPPRTGFPAPAAAEGHGKGRDGEKNKQSKEDAASGDGRRATHPPTTRTPRPPQPPTHASPGSVALPALAIPGWPGSPCGSAHQCSCDLEKGGAGEGWGRANAD